MSESGMIATAAAVACAVADALASFGGQAGRRPLTPGYLTSLLPALP
jgi:CO/xanthine dehydrogenase Mo-binding subunit